MGTLEATLEDERQNMLEMKNLKEKYESQIKILKRNCDKEVRKLTNDLEDRRSKTREEKKSETIVVNSGNYMIQFPKQENKKRRTKKILKRTTSTENSDDIKE